MKRNFGGFKIGEIVDTKDGNGEILSFFTDTAGVYGRMAEVENCETGFIKHYPIKDLKK